MGYPGRNGLAFGKTVIVADAHKDDVRLIVHAECLATAMLELNVQALRQTATAGRSYGFTSK